jgi:hypothetical protein
MPKVIKDGLGVGIGGGALVPQNLAGTAGDEMPLKRKKKITVLGTPIAGLVKQKIAHSLIKQIIQKAFPVGTVRQHKDGVKYKKEAPGKWVPVTGDKASTAEPAKPDHAAELEREDIAAGDVTFKGMKFEKMANGFMSMKPIEPEAADVLKDAVKDLKGVMYNGANKNYIVPPIHANAILKRTADKYESKLNETIGKTGQLDLFALDELDKIDDMKKISRTPPPETPVKTPDGKDGKIVDRKLDKEKNPVFTVQTADGKTTEVPEKKLEVKPQQDQSVVDMLFANASPENRDQVATALNGGKWEEKTDEVKAFDIKEPELAKKMDIPILDRTSREWKANKESKLVYDKTGYQVHRSATKDELKKESPIDFPDMLDNYKMNNGRFDYVKTGDNQYLVKLQRQNGTREILQGQFKRNVPIYEDHYILANADVLAYNRDKASRLYKQNLKEQKEKIIKEIDEKFPNMSQAGRTRSINLKLNKISTYKKGEMTWKHHDLIGAHLPAGATTRDIQKKFSEWESELGYRENDLESIQEYSESTYTKGEETSYGKKNEIPPLKDKHGIMIKRQNGKPLSDTEVKTIDSFMNGVGSFYGDHKKVYNDFGLRVSFSGAVNMHASKASGIFYPKYRAIGVSDAHASLTAIHEFAHLHDFLDGGQTNYMSHREGTHENKIAKTFREKMTKDKKYYESEKNYWSRSHECFARAMAQYYQKKYENEEYNDDNKGIHNHRYHVPDNLFSQHIEPIIDEYLKVKREVKKAMDRFARARAVWMGGKSTPFFLGDK